jgi:hypothetical protein
MSREDVSSEKTSALMQVLSELADLFDLAEGAVVVGGTVPFLLIPQASEPHEGTVDVDIVLDRKKKGFDDVYTLHELLERNSYVQGTTKPFQYTKAVLVNGALHEINVELLGGGVVPPGGLARIQTEDVYVSVIPGLEVALDGPIAIDLPGDSQGRILVTSFPGFFAMKSLALATRDGKVKSKDAYDIVYCLRNYPGGVEAAAEQFRAMMGNPLVREGLDRIEQLFSDTAAIGPKAYAMSESDPDEAQLMRREAIERVHEFVALVRAHDP